MKINPRLEHIVSLVDERGFLSVGELSQLCSVSEMTIRRDLEYLDNQKRIQRTYGGAVSLRTENITGIDSGSVIATGTKSGSAFTGQGGCPDRHFRQPLLRQSVD